ncbi:MAG TPA: YdcF family protein [Pyrinomonadaceae bacterium]|nr:YdcF family protein [Pyrinomonadaceae bacterium]
MNERAHGLAEKLWHYHRMNHRLREADAVLVLCSYDRRVAERGAELLLGGWSPLLIFSGGLGTITSRMWSEPEADQFARVARAMGVPGERILVENRSTNTGENVVFTRRLLAERGLDPNSFILVQKPYMERRSYATFRKFWPEKEAVVTSPQVSFDEYLNDYTELPADEVVGIMVGDLQRIRLYPARGFQIPQEIPEEVWAAYEELVAAGYDTHLVER